VFLLDCGHFLASLLERVFTKIGDRTLRILMSRTPFAQPRLSAGARR
jgi:hypothetical protein